MLLWQQCGHVGRDDFHPVLDIYPTVVRQVPECPLGLEYRAGVDRDVHWVDEPWLDCPGLL